MTQSLKQLHLRDFGADLPICGGWGQSREDPIIVTETDPLEAVQAEMLVLRDLGRGRGIYWRKLGRSLLGPSRPGIEQVKIETVELTADQMITQTENYYFDMRASTKADKVWHDTVLVSHTDPSGLAFPFEIGWLHFGSVTDNESAEPGLGITLAYGAPGIKGTVYVYDLQRRDIPDAMNAPWLHAHFEKAAEDVIAINSGVSAWPDPTSSDPFRVRYYRAGDDARFTTVLWMTSSRGKIIKARATWTRDHFVDKVGNGFLKSLLMVAGLSQ